MTIINTGIFWPPESCNDNSRRLVAKWDGWNFLGFVETEQ
jgi:hypothetical protein